MFVVVVDCDEDGWGLGLILIAPLVGVSSKKISLMKESVTQIRDSSGKYFFFPRASDTDVFTTYLNLHEM